MLDKLRLDGKVALVSGGTGWLGSKMCVALHACGAEVHAVSRGVSKSFLDDGIASVHRCDLSDKHSVDEFLPSFLETHNVDVLINNSYRWPSVVNFADATWEGISSTVEGGLVSQLYITKHVFDAMVKRELGGSIINVSSMYAKVSPDVSMYRGAGGNAIEYGATKAALIQATKYLAMLGGKNNIRVNSISPGPFPRPGAFDGKEWFREELEKRTMLKRVGNAQEIGGVVVFLASDMSSYITGVDIPIDGGWTAW